jgi:hypothetical protein
VFDSELDILIRRIPINRIWILKNGFDDGFSTKTILSVYIPSGVGERIRYTEQTWPMGRAGTAQARVRSSCARPGTARAGMCRNGPCRPTGSAKQHKHDTHGKRAGPRHGKARVPALDQGV